MGGLTNSEPSPNTVPAGAPSDAGLEAVLDATHQLLWIETPAEAAAIARSLITVLGGATVPARASTSDALPVDVSFGDGEPLVPVAPPLSVARMLLERHLPAFMVDAQRALELSSKTERLAQDASIDALTGLANRRMLDRLLGRLHADDIVIMVDLDHFKVVNDTLGHAQGDRVLKSLGHTLAATLRARDHAGISSSEAS